MIEEKEVGIKISTQRVFKSLCNVPKKGEAERLRQALDVYGSIINQSQDPFQKKLALELRNRSYDLLSILLDTNEEMQAKIVGAVKYFIMRNEGIPDNNAEGYLDDAYIMNRVLKELGQKQIQVQVQVQVQPIQII